MPAMPATHALVQLLGEVALLLWGVHMVRSGVLRAFGGGPAGIEAIAHTMNLSPDTLSDEVEPYLLRTELVIRSPRGRVVTAKAYEHLQITPSPADEPQRRLFGS